MVNKFSLIKTLFTVDGRKLNTHNVIKNIQFTKIVFMFPHVGGKMKINLNRDLLMAIFESAHQVLDNTGEHIINTPLGALDGIGLGASWPSIFNKFKKEKVKLFWKFKENFLFRIVNNFLLGFFCLYYKNLISKMKFLFSFIILCTWTIKVHI